MKTTLLVFLTLTACLLVTGCGGSGAITDPVAPAITGSLTVSLTSEVVAKVLGDRFVFDDVLVQCRKVSDNSVLREAVLTPQNPSTTMTGLPGGTVCYIYAAARRGGVTFSSGRSANITIVAGSNVNASVVIDATNPTFSNLSPAGGTTVTSSSVAMSLTVTDPGGKVPSSTITVDGTAYGPFTSTTPSVDLTGLAEGTHTVAVQSTTASGGSGSTSWSFTIDTGGGGGGILPQFANWPGFVHTFVDSVSATTLSVTASTAPGSTESTVEIVILDDGSGRRLRVEGILDLTTALMTGGWRLVEVDGVTQPNPGGSTGLWNYNSTTSHLRILNVTVYADGYSVTISQIDVDLASTNLHTP